MQPHRFLPAVIFHGFWICGPWQAAYARLCPRTSARATITRAILHDWEISWGGIADLSAEALRAKAEGVIRRSGNSNEGVMFAEEGIATNSNGPNQA
jgi:hypothetical protein